MLMRTATQGAKAPQCFPIGNGDGNPITGSIELMGVRAGCGARSTAAGK